MCHYQIQLDSSLISGLIRILCRSVKTRSCDTTNSIITSVNETQVCQLHINGFWLYSECPGVGKFSMFASRMKPDTGHKAGVHGRGHRFYILFLSFFPPLNPTCLMSRFARRLAEIWKVCAALLPMMTQDCPPRKTTASAVVRWSAPKWHLFTFTDR